jgi:hypothetical protein
MNGENVVLTWEAPEHRHIEKTSDWYWALGIIAVSASVASMMFGNVLFGVVILLGASTVILFSHRLPKIISFELSSRGIRMGHTLYLFKSLEAYSIDEDAPFGPQLILKSKHFLMPLLIVPLPEEELDFIDQFLSTQLSKEHLEEPLSHRILELFGF